MPRSDRLQPDAVVDIRYGQVGLVQVRVHTTNPGTILDELTGRVATAPHFFRRTGVCLDLSVLEHSVEVPEVQAVIDALRRAGMLVVGLSGEVDALAAISAALALPVLTTFRTPTRPVPVVQPVGSAATPAVAGSGPPAEQAGATPANVPGSLSAQAAAASILGTAGAAHSGISIAQSAAVEPTATAAQAAEVAWAGQAALIHAQTVRSGQRVYGRGRDLIVTASVGPGAEVMADGCVHVYGALRGRVMAGAHGQLGARVFCQQFYAELVSIAGVFRVFETIPPELAGAPVQAWLAGEELRFARIG